MSYSDTVKKRKRQNNRLNNSTEKRQCIVKKNNQNIMQQSTSSEERNESRNEYLKSMPEILRRQNNEKELETIIFLCDNLHDKDNKDVQIIWTFCNLLLLWIGLLKITLLFLKSRCQRRWWVKPHISREIRNNQGAYLNLFLYLKENDHYEFEKLTRCSVEQFNYLHNLVKPKLIKTSIREPLSTEFRLAITLNILANGDSIRTISLWFRIGKSTLYSIIPEVCKIIWDVLQPEYLKCPQSEDEWLRIATEYFDLWNFPNCIGAIDGKHCNIQALPHSGSKFHNYKGFFSIVLMAVVDAKYNFIWVDIGDYGSMNDAGIWSKTALRKALEENTINLPKARPLPYTDRSHPFALVGDEGFPLKTFLMRPFPRRNLKNVEAKVFNYRLSRARRIVENAFGILVARWKILQRPMAFKLNTLETIIQATVCLHNFINKTQKKSYPLQGFVDYENKDGKIILGSWRNMIKENNLLSPLGQIGTNTGTTTAVKQRESLAQYFVSDEGSIPWQWQMI